MKYLILFHFANGLSEYFVQYSTTSHKVSTRARIEFAKEFHSYAEAALDLSVIPYDQFTFVTRVEIFNKAGRYAAAVRRNFRLIVSY
jgi:hypothetical protein